MAEHCEKHPETKLIVTVFKYCPVCRGGHGGKIAAKGMTATERTKRARKAAKARWKRVKKSLKPVSQKSHEQ
jgi:hypothetical protein